MAKMTQTQILAEMSTKTGISKKQVKDFMTSLTDLAYREAKKGEFAFPGLGKLVKQKRKARNGPSVTCLKLAAQIFWTFAAAGPFWPCSSS